MSNFLIRFFLLYFVSVFLVLISSSSSSSDELPKCVAFFGFFCLSSSYFIQLADNITTVIPIFRLFFIRLDSIYPFRFWTTYKMRNPSIVCLHFLLCDYNQPVAAVLESGLFAHRSNCTQSINPRTLNLKL